MKVSRPVRRGADGKGPTLGNLAGRLPYYEISPEALTASLATIQQLVRQSLAVVTDQQERHQPAA